MHFIFLEIIELNFWGLNENIKKNIEKRASFDLIEDYRDSVFDNDNADNNDNGETITDNCIEIK